MAARVKGGKKLEAFLRDARNAQKVRSVEVGFFSTARYPDGTPVASVAAWNEFGTRVSPERPFMRQAMEGMKEAVAPLVKHGVNKRTMVISPKLGDVIGLVVQARIQRSIIKLRDPANAPSTVKAKKSANPLVDTGTMLRSVTFETTR